MRRNACRGGTAGTHFNPRTPCGVRRSYFSLFLSRVIFQSTHPLRGATDVQPRPIGGDVISIHAPLAGCDNCVKICDRNFHKFQSTHSLRGATYVILAFTFWVEFQSTHPLRGATMIAMYLFIKYFDFNPRTPCGVRPGNIVGYRIGDLISIHAPLAGCDTLSRSLAICFRIFQSTHPLRGATSCAPFRAHGRRFQSTHPLRGATSAIQSS